MPRCFQSLERGRGYPQSQLGGKKMKIKEHQVPSLLCVAVIVGMFALGPVALGHAPANNKYDGSYHGTYSGSFAGDSAKGAVAFSVVNGNMTVTDPGHGAGSVDYSGATTFSGSLGLAKITCKFVGNFKSSTSKKHGAHASGSWSCAGMGQTGKGTWSADQ
jgi:hypothetical protein